MEEKKSEKKFCLGKHLRSHISLEDIVTTLIFCYIVYIYTTMTFGIIDQFNQQLMERTIEP